MKQIIILISILALFSCSKKNNPTPGPIVNTNTPGGVKKVTLYNASGVYQYHYIPKVGSTHLKYPQFLNISDPPYSLLYDSLFYGYTFFKNTDTINDVTMFSNSSNQVTRMDTKFYDLGNTIRWNFTWLTNPDTGLTTFEIWPPSSPSHGTYKGDQYMTFEFTGSMLTKTYIYNYKFTPGTLVGSRQYIYDVQNRISQATYRSASSSTDSILATFTYTNNKLYREVKPASYTGNYFEYTYDGQGRVSRIDYRKLTDDSLQAYFIIEY